MKRHNPVLHGLILAAWLVGGLAGSASASTAPKKGDVVRIEGQVVDRQNRLVSRVDVVLEVSRSRFSLRKLDRIEGEVLRLPMKSDAEGRFAFDWRWDGHHNTFSLGVGLEVKREGRPDFEFVARQDISDLVASGAPVKLRLEVAEAGYLRWLRDYLAGKASADEERIYRQQGRPDRIEASSHFAGETTWWYFAEGKAYLFRSGVFERELAFDPVPDAPIAANG